MNIIIILPIQASSMMTTSSCGTGPVTTNTVIFGNFFLNALAAWIRLGEIKNTVSKSRSNVTI